MLPLTALHCFRYRLTAPQSQFRCRTLAQVTSCQPMAGLYATRQHLSGLVVTVNLWSVTVNINNTFATLLNGLCGNFDGNKTNDLMTENGTDVSGQPRGQGPKMIGDSYVVEDPEQLNGTAYVGLRFLVMAVMCIIVYVLGFRWVVCFFLHVLVTIQDSEKMRGFCKAAKTA